jgi:hypothetical protein
MDQQNVQQELAFIKKVMEDSRRLFIYDGKDMIVWGCIVLIGMILMFSKFQYGLRISAFLIWGVLIGIGWIFSVWRGMRIKRMHRVKTLSGRIVSSIWIACGVCMTIVGFGFTSTGLIHGWAINPLLSLFIGVAYFTSATVLDLRYMYGAGIAWWGGALLMALWNGPHTFLIFGLLMIVFHIVPGIVFYKKWKKDYTPESVATV